MTDRPHVRTDPAQRFGRPAIDGVSVDSIGGAVWNAEDAATDYGLTRPQVLVACWWLGTYGTKRWRDRFGTWARSVEGEFQYRRYDVADPPTKEDE